MAFNFARAAALIVSAAALAGPAFAQTSTTSLPVTGEIVKTCYFYNADAIAFNIIDPRGSVPSQTGKVYYKCTNGTTPTFSFTSTSGVRSLTSGSDTLSYTLVETSKEVGGGFTSSDQKVAIFTASVADADVQKSKPGNYSDSVTLTIGVE
jgi:spore coat protein U-like protein